MTTRPRSDFGNSIDQIFMLISSTTLAIFLAVLLPRHGL
jgi:hypothetical protein